MDGLSELLDGPRANGAFLLQAVMDPPWSIRIEDRAPLSVTAVVSGEAWVITTTATRSASVPASSS